jgi:hypothetical protein
VIVALVGPGAAAQQNKDKDKKEEEAKPKKLDKAQQQDVDALVKLVDAKMNSAGGAAPTGSSGLNLSLKTDFLKALQGQTYVPFTVTLDPAFAGVPLAVYLRVVDKTAPPPAPAEEKKEKKTDFDRDPYMEQPAEEKEAPPPVHYAFEDIYWTQVKAEPGSPLRLSRAFAVAAGEYDTYIAIKERTADKNATPRTAVLKEVVKVPDFWSNQLTTSSVILAERVDPVKEQPTKDAQLERPYLLGTTEIVPSLDSKFGKKDDLSIIFLIYNPGVGADKRPDVTVEYAFHQKAAEGEKYFNKTSPQKFDSSTLPAQFDFDAGHQLVAGQSIPLASFPEGEYRLEIKVSDNISKQSLTRNLNFTVQGP